jgi:hypothetical protein
MNRRNFFKSLGLLLGAAAITPTAVFTKELPEVKSIKTKKLKVMWSEEMARDLEVYHGIDIDKELRELINQEINREIQEEIDGEVIRILEQKSFSPTSFAPYTHYTVEYI